MCLKTTFPVHGNIERKYLIVFVSFFEFDISFYELLKINLCVENTVCKIEDKMKFIRAFIFAILSFCIVYIIPFTAKFIENLIKSFPKSLGQNGEFILKILLALLIWDLLLILFGARRKN